MSVQTIYTTLRNCGMSQAGACGLMGNLKCESNLRANNAENYKSPYTDEEYTRLADAGKIDFVNDYIGYGLAQWTFWDRKQNLLNFAKERGVSVGDETMQLEFCLHEIQVRYPSLWNELTTITSLYKAVEDVCNIYEKPKNPNIEQRYIYAREIFDELKLEGDVMDYSGYPTIQLGSSGYYVKELQTLLIKLGYDLGSWGADGDFGSSTKSALKLYQSSKGLSADGVCGPATWSSFNTQEKQPDVPFSPDLTSAISNVIAIAKNEVGYLEKATNSNLDSKTGNAGSNNYTKYSRDLDAFGNFYNGAKQGFAWCDVFVDWCMVKAFGRELAQKMINQSNGSAGAGCKQSSQYYQAINRFYSKPQPGDQIFFVSGGDICHTGLVIDVTSTQVITIEGNTSGGSGVIANGGGVFQKSYSLNYSGIYGYGRPKYELVPSKQEDEPEPVDTKDPEPTPAPAADNSALKAQLVTLYNQLAEIIKKL